MDILFIKKLKSIWKDIKNAFIIDSKKKIIPLLIILLALIIWDLQLILDLPVADDFSSLSVNYFVLLGLAVAIFAFMLTYTILKTKSLNKKEIQAFEEKIKIDYNKIYECGVKEFRTQDKAIIKVKFKEDKLVITHLIYDDFRPLPFYKRVSQLVKDKDLSLDDIFKEIHNNLDYYFATKIQEIDYKDVKAFASVNWRKDHITPELFIRFRVPLSKEFLERDDRSYAQKRSANEFYGVNSQEFVVQFSNELFYQLAKHNIELTNRQALNAKPLKKKPKFKSIMESKPINSKIAYLTTFLIFLSGIAVSYFLPHLSTINILTIPISLYLFVKLYTRPNFKINEKYIATPETMIPLNELQFVKIFPDEEGKLFLGKPIILIKTPTQFIKILNTKKNEKYIKKYVNNDIIQYE